jgi:hypothetical protein
MKEEDMNDDRMDKCEISESSKREGREVDIDIKRTEERKICQK